MGRLNDGKVSAGDLTRTTVYDAAGRVTATWQPASAAADAGATVTAYFAIDLVATQTQGGTVKSFTLDPAGRLGGATDTIDGTTTRSVVNHYADPSDAPAWITTTTGGQASWTRNVAGLAGDLAATEDSTGAVVLQLANLHGDIVATAADDPAATGTTGYFEATEYGTPRPANTATPDRYGWLGAKERSTDDLAGLVLMGVRLYNPDTGCFLQPDPVPGGSAGPYLYPTNPIDGYDLNGQWWSWLKKAAHWVSQNRHRIVNLAVGVVAATGTAVCIGLVVCGGALFVVGAAAVFAGGLGAHYAVSTPADRRRGMGRYVASTAFAEAKGVVCGALFGRGCVTGGLRGPRAGSLLHGVSRAQWMRHTMQYVRSWL